MRIRRALEWSLGAFAAANCILVAVSFGIYQLSPPFDDWRTLFPLPGLYLLEVAALGVAGFLTAATDAQRGGRLPPEAIWFAAGALLTFVILGGFSIGPYLFLPTAALVITGVLLDLRNGRSLLRGPIIAFLTSLAQAAVMFLAIAAGA